MNSSVSHYFTFSETFLFLVGVLERFSVVSRHGIDFPPAARSALLFSTLKRLSMADIKNSRHKLIG